VISNGALDKLASISIQHNPIGDAGLAALAQAASSRSGALANLQQLDLGFTKIGNAGFKVFASAITSGAMESLKTLSICTPSGVLEHPDLKAACNSRDIRLSCHVESLS